ncbi:MAG: hypothetical protein HYY06_01305 [Deltaproteobacteria bacterium]|nr:hypothetical protein [Deltaproteobacteria bacterium]
MLVRGWVAIAALAFSAGAARADEIEDAERRLADLDYTDAINILEGMLRRGEADARDLARIYELLGKAAASSGEDSQAVWAYTRLLALDPEFELGSGVSPRLRRAMSTARRELPEDASVRLQLRAPRQAWAERPTSIALEVGADGLGLVRGMRVYHRREGATSYSRVTVRGPPPLETVIPAFSTPRAGRRLEYWVAALDEYGNELASMGSRGRPLSLPVRNPPADSSSGRGHSDDDDDDGGITKRWWFWTGLVAVAAGATVGLLLLTAEEPSCPEGGACYSVQIERPE